MQTQTQCTVNVNKNLLLRTLRQNRDDHIESCNTVRDNYIPVYLKTAKKSYDASRKQITQRIEALTATLQKAIEDHKLELDTLNEKYEALLSKGESFVPASGDFGFGMFSSTVHVPENHEQDYDKAIAMIEMHEGDTFELSREEYGNFILDNWRWKSHFERCLENFT